MQNRIVALGISLLSTSLVACGWIAGIEDTTTGEGTCEGCDVDGDGFCAEGFDPAEFPGTCVQGGGDCDDAQDSVFPGAEDQCGASDFNCDQQRPSLDFSAVSVIRGTPGAAFGEELAYNGSEFAAIFAEDIDLNRTAKVVTLSSAGTVADGPVALTGPNVAVSSTAIDWDDASGRWGALYVTASADEREFTLNLTTLDSNLLNPETFSLGAVNSNLVRIVGAGGFFVLFYSKEVASQSGVHFRSFNTATKALSAERLLTVDRSSLSGSSIAWAGGSQIMLAWDDFDSAQTPRRGVNIAVVTASGSVQSAYVRRNFPGNEEGERPTVHAANGKFYLIWELPNGATQTTVDFLLRTSELSTSGGFVGLTRTVANDAASFGGRTLVAESETIMGLLYMGIDVSAGTPFPQATRLGRFDASWALQSLAETWFTSIDFTHSRAVHGYFRGNEYYVMDAGGSTGYFVIYGVDRNNPGAPTSGVEREPITPATFSSNYSNSLLTVRYDAAADGIEVMQRNTNDSSLLETYRIDAAGAASDPAPLGPVAPGCSNYQLERDGLACYRNVANFDELPCFIPFPGMQVDPVYNFTRHTFDDGEWTTTVLSELPGFHEEFAGFCLEPDVRFPVVTTQAGLVAVVGIPVGEMFIEGVDWEKHLYSPTSGHTVEVIRAHTPGESVGSPLIASRGEDHWFAYTVSTADTRQLLIQRIDHATGELAGPAVELVSIPSANSAVFLESIHHNGVKLGVVYTIRDSTTTPSVDTSLLAFVDADGGVTTPTAIEDVQNINLVLVGDSGYNAVIETSGFGQRVRVYDDEGAPLEAGVLDYTTIGTPTLQLFYTGHDFRALLGVGNRVLYAGGACTTR